MNELRSTYLESYRALRTIAADPVLAERWEMESCLKDFSVKGLAGHVIVRTGWAVLDYLEADVEAGGSPIEGPEYYAKVLEQMDSASHEMVRVRGEESAPDGPDALLARFDEASARLEERLESEPEERLVKVFGGHLMRLDDYLVTRMCEILIHADDLAISLDLEPIGFPHEAWVIVLDHLLQVARLTKGDRAVLMAFSRRERDATEALRVF